VAYLADNLGRLSVLDGSEILLHCRVIVSFLIQVIPIFSEYHVLLDPVDTGLLRKIYGEDVQIPLI
jgi:hypothetical protein